MKKLPLLIIAVVVVIVGAILIISNIGNHGSDCQGESCWKALGFENEKEYKNRDATFLSADSVLAKRINIYIESSASMDGYVNGHTSFKTIVHRLCGQLKADILANNNLSFNFINSDVFPVKVQNDNYTKDLTPASFAAKGGDRANSDIIDIIRKVVNSTGPGEVSMFVSDCVYSPEAAEDINKALEIQQTDMLNILKNKGKSNSQFGVLLYRVVSDFHGIYYTKTNAHITIPNGHRPFFVWFFGDSHLLGKVFHSVDGIMQKEKADYLVGLPKYKYIPYKTIGSNHAYHYTAAKASNLPESKGGGKDDGLAFFPCTFLADLNTLPLRNEYLTDPANYSLKKNRWQVKNVRPYSSGASSDSKNSKKVEVPYNMKFSLEVFGEYDDYVPGQDVEVELLSMLRELPSWVEKYDDPKGNDYDKGYVESRQRTFGLKSLVEGIKDYYTSPEYVTFHILINDK